MEKIKIGKIVNAGASLAGSYASRELAHKYDFVYFCLLYFTFLPISTIIADLREHNVCYRACMCSVCAL